VCNSLAGLLPVVALDDWRWPVSALQRDLRDMLFAMKD
jgi:hypothetical protein